MKELFIVSKRIVKDFIFLIIYNLIVRQSITPEMVRYCGKARQQYSFCLEDKKKKNAEKNWQPKNYIKYRDKEIQGRMTFLQKSSKSFDTEFVKLVKQAEDSKFIFFFCYQEWIL